MSTGTGFIPLTVLWPTKGVKWVFIRHIVSFSRGDKIDTIVEFYNNTTRSIEVVQESPEEINELIRLNSK